MSILSYSFNKTKEAETLENNKLTKLAVIAAIMTAFSAAEFYGAHQSKALCLLADATCLALDAISYILSYVGESIKIGSKGSKLDVQTAVFIEITIPFMSMLLLSAVSIYTLVKAINILMYPPESEDETVDVNYIYGFSAANLMLDAFCLWLLLQEKNVFDENLVVCTEETEEALIDHSGGSLNTYQNPSDRQRGKEFVIYLTPYHIYI